MAHALPRTVGACKAPDVSAKAFFAKTIDVDAPIICEGIL